MKQTAFFAILLSFVLVGCKDKLDSDQQKGLDAACAFVQKFRDTHLTLPTRDDFLAWFKDQDLYGVCDYQLSEDGKYYSVYIWRGERMTVYSSKDKSLHDEDRPFRKTQLTVPFRSPRFLHDEAILSP